MTEINSLVDLVGLGRPAVAVGQIVRITPEDLPIVDYPGNQGGPVQARIAVEPPLDRVFGWPPVLLAFENGDPVRPIIVGFVREKVKASALLSKSRRVRKLVFDAEEEILLRCGKSSVLLRRDGRIVIKGGDVVSRASGTNKVQGGAVRLN